MVRKEVLVGLIVGILANALGLFLSATLLGKGEDFIMVLKSAAAEGFSGKQISLGAVLNLIAFFIFIKKKQDYRARGVLLATILVAVFTFLLNFN